MWCRRGSRVGCWVVAVDDRRFWNFGGLKNAKGRQAATAKIAARACTDQPRFQARFTCQLRPGLTSCQIQPCSLTPLFTYLSFPLSRLFKRPQLLNFSPSSFCILWQGFEDLAFNSSYTCFPNYPGIILLATSARSPLNNLPISTVTVPYSWFRTRPLPNDILA